MQTYFDLFHIIITLYMMGLGIYFFWHLYKYRHQPKLREKLSQKFEILKKEFVEYKKTGTVVTEHAIYNLELKLLTKPRIDFETAKLYSLEIEYYRNKIKDPETILPPR